MYLKITNSLREENLFHLASLKQLKIQEFPLLFSQETILLPLGAWTKLFIFLNANTQMISQWFI